MPTQWVAIGLTVMLVSWAVSFTGLETDAALSSDYNAACTPPSFPLRKYSNEMAKCANLSAQVGEASTVAVVGGVAGFAGLAYLLLGVRRESEP